METTLSKLNILLHTTFLFMECGFHRKCWYLQGRKDAKQSTPCLRTLPCSLLADILQPIFATVTLSLCIATEEKSTLSLIHLIAMPAISLRWKGIT